MSIVYDHGYADFSEQFTGDFGSSSTYRTKKDSEIAETLAVGGTTYLWPVGVVNLDLEWYEFQLHYLQSDYLVM